MKIRIALLCVLLSLQNLYADSANLDLMSIIDLYNEVEAINYDYEELQKAYEAAKKREQSFENRALTALTVAATGIGGMELARGLAEQNADEDAEKDMAAYIETMRCSYGDGKHVKAGPEEIELPGGNDANIMKYRNEYFALASDLKTRKNALGMKPGIESEEIMERAQMGLYDDENTGITGGGEASLYRAQMLDSDKDKTNIDESKEASSSRVKGGAIAAGAGVVGGVVGDNLINGGKSSGKASSTETDKQDTSKKNKQKK